VALKQLRKDDSHTESELKAVRCWSMHCELTIPWLSGSPDSRTIWTCAPPGVPSLLSSFSPDTSDFQAKLLRKHPHKHVVKTFSQTHMGRCCQWNCVTVVTCLRWLLLNPVVLYLSAPQSASSKASCLPCSTVMVSASITGT
jgi:hypothetical protein